MHIFYRFFSYRKQLCLESLGVKEMTAHEEFFEEKSSTQVAVEKKS